MLDRRRLIYLVLAMLLAFGASGVMTIHLLYEASFEQQRARLVDTVNVQARMIEAVARHHEAAPDGAEEATLAQVHEAHEASEGLGETGEFVLARRVGDQIVFLLSHRHQDFDDPKPVSFAVEAAEPMRRALSGQSGSVVGLDYRGEVVLAAYEPVGVLGLGAVAKIDLSELQAPFIEAATYGGLAAILAILLSAWMFVRPSRKLIKKLEVSEAYNRTIVQTAPDGIITIDADGIIETFNPSAEHMFGYDADEVVGRSVDELIPAAAEPAAGPVAFLQNTSSNGDRELTGERKDGTGFPLELTSGGLPQASGGKLTCMVRDVTRRKQLEGEVQQAHRLEAVGRLAGGIAHDFNNLLMGVSGCADILLATLEPQHAAREYAEEIKRAALSGASIVGQLLSFSRKKQDEPVVSHLNSIIDENENMLRRLLGEDVELMVGLNDSDLWVECDRGQVEQVLMNLVVNARDAMKRGGTLTIGTSELVVSAGDSLQGDLDVGRYAVLSVSDEGSGIDEETMAQIFDPFFTTKEVGEGTGLGLSTVYGIVQRAGGHIDLDSELDEGTTFHIYLPTAEEPAPAEELESVSPISLRGRETVLLVEDEPLVRRSVRHYLEGWGYSVLEAASRAEAVDACKGHKGTIHLLLTDSVLPGGSGKTVVRAVRDIVPDVAVIQMSAHSPDKLIRDGRLADGVPLLQKPFTAEVLAAKIREVLGESAWPPAVEVRGEAEVRETPAATEQIDKTLSGSKPSILLVEDHGTSRKAIQMLLELEGYHVMGAATGAQALALCNDDAKHVDLVLTDFGLPDTKGPALVEALRDAEPTLKGVIYISGRSVNDPEVEQALQQPDTHFVGKPIDFDALEQVVRGVLG
jgi:two-component system cell cycle sensor histidine kinase/response regulator CckA